MSDLPAVQLRSFSPGRDPATQSGGGLVVGGAGAEDFVAIVPLAEVDGAGSPPVEPDHVAGVEPAWAVRRVVGGSGAPVTSSLATAPRPRFRVGWGALDADERDAVLAWLLVDVGLGGAGGSLRAMSIRVDGPDADPTEMRIIDAGGEVERCVEYVRDGEVVYSVGPFDCEAVL